MARRRNTTSEPEEMVDPVLAKVMAIAAEEAGMDDEEVAATSRLVDDLGMDSLDVVEFIMALESEFAIEIDDEDADQLVQQPLQAIAAFVGARVTR